MRIFITLMLLVFLISDTLSSSHHRPTRGPSQITKLIDNLKNLANHEEQQETNIQTKIQQTVEKLKTAAADVSNKINGFITRKRKVKKETLEKLKELELKLSQLNTSVKECLQRLIKANQKRSGQKDPMGGRGEPTEVKKQDDDDNRKESSVGKQDHLRTNRTPSHRIVIG